MGKLGCKEGLSIAERIDINVDKSSGCWIWLLDTLPYGYGKIKVEGKTKRAHRVSWEEFNGQIPEGMCVLHNCDVPACVNPEHLFLGTQADNMRDMKQKSRWRGRFSGVNSCKLGHTFSSTPSGKRVCKICENKRHRDQYYRRKNEQD